MLLKLQTLKQAAETKWSLSLTDGTGFRGRGSRLERFSARDDSAGQSCQGWTSGESQVRLPSSNLPTTLDLPMAATLSFDL